MLHYPRLQLDNTLHLSKMSQEIEGPPSIDQVLQNEQPFRRGDFFLPGDRPLTPLTSNYTTSAQHKEASTVPTQAPPLQRPRAVSIRASGHPGTHLACGDRRLRLSDGLDEKKYMGVGSQVPLEAMENGVRVRSATAVIRNMTTNQNPIVDFFSPEVFRVVIHNPTTAHRFLRFCQSQGCGENMEFLQKVERLNRLLNEVQVTLGEIHTTYTSPDAPHHINVPQGNISSNVKQATEVLLPGLGGVFLDAQHHIEKQLARDIYPRFVKHQVTTQATTALVSHRERFQGLGDCFCLTDPGRADNPILYASDGFVSVTGYSRKDIVPRNCRFLQGELTDPSAKKRLRVSIGAYEETVELLLNYRKNGDPFWNLLYVSPLFDEHGKVSFFLGGQIDCSTTIRSCTDVLRILSFNDDELDRIGSLDTHDDACTPVSTTSESRKTRSSFFRSRRKFKTSTSSRLNIKERVGMEQELLHRVGAQSFETQVEAFYTAYSKYIVMTYNTSTSALLVQHYSPGIIDILCLQQACGAITPIYNKDIFKVLSDHSYSSSSSHRAFKETVTIALRNGRAVSVEMGLSTAFEENSGSGGHMLRGEKARSRKVDEKYISHWTPLKDEEGRTAWIVLAIAPMM